MKTMYLLLTLLLLVSTQLFGQVEKVPSQEEIERRMREANQQIKEAMDEMSPEDRKRVEEAMAKGKSDLNNIEYPIASSDVKTEIPKKQTGILAKIPTLSTETQYHTYLDKMTEQTKTSIPKNIRDEVEKLLSNNNSDKTKLNNLAPLLLINKNPKAAVYAALRVANMNKDELLCQNNLAVILHQTGYPQYALPVLEYQLTKNPLATLYNNAAQCYLSLGETPKAESYFAICLSMDPQNYEAHCGTALILINQQKIPQAVPHIEKALRNGHSPALAKLVTDKKINLDYNKFKPHNPEYFNPNKYRAPIPARTLEDIKTVLAQREETEERMYKWGEKSSEMDEKHAEMIEKESVMQMSQRFPGMMSNLPFSRKAMFMLSESYKESGRLIQQTVNEENKNIAKQMHEELIANIDKRYKEGNFGSRYEECVMLKEETEKYLVKSAEHYDRIVRNSVFKYYDIVNQQLYWNKYLLNHNGYEQMFYNVTPELFVHLEEYDRFQILTKPKSILDLCEQTLQNPPEKTVWIEESPDMNCPFKININLGAGSLKMDCKGWEIEGGALVVLGIQKDYKTGELTLAFGLGAKIPVPTFAEIGGKGQMFFKFDSDGQPVDCGMVFEAGAEASVGTISIEEKGNATIGMVSGVHVTGVAAGQETAIFTLEP